MQGIYVSRIILGGFKTISYPKKTVGFQNTLDSQIRLLKTLMEPCPIEGHGSKVLKAETNGFSVSFTT